MARVLIVEDETVLRSAMARGIAKMSGVTVAEAGTLQAAIEQIDVQPPGMIISDIDLPDRSGLELLGELGRRGLRVPVVFVSAYLKAYGAQIPPHADVEVREKPIQLDELRALVEQRLTGAARTEEAPFGPADYLQLACLGHRSVVIEVEGGDVEGSIVVHEGTLWSARDRRGVGEGAFQRLAFSEGAAVRVRVLHEDPGPRILHVGWEQLLIDAARRHDEEVRDSLLDLDVDAVTGLDLLGPATPPDDAALAFDAAFEAGVEALLARDYAAAFVAFERADAIRPHDSKVEANLERLRQLGHGRSDSSDP